MNQSSSISVFDAGTETFHIIMKKELQRLVIIPPNGDRKVPPMVVFYFIDGSILSVTLSGMFDYPSTIQAAREWLS